MQESSRLRSSNSSHDRLGRVGVRGARSHFRGIAPLMVMVQGVTEQLSVLLGEQAEERRAELERQREEALAQAQPAAEAARAALVELATTETPASSSEEAQAGSEEGEPSPAESPKAKDKSKKHGGGGRGPPPELEAEIRVLRPETCVSCGGDDLFVQETRTSTEDPYVRAHVRLLDTHRVFVGCKTCDEVTTPPQPPMPFERATCTFELMAWLCFARCGLFLPLDRLRRDFEAQGARIPSATLDRWFDRAAELLTPLWVCCGCSCCSNRRCTPMAPGCAWCSPGRRRGRWDKPFDREKWTTRASWSSAPPGWPGRGLRVRRGGGLLLHPHQKRVPSRGVPRARRWRRCRATGRCCSGGATCWEPGASGCTPAAPGPRPRATLWA